MRISDWSSDVCSSDLATVRSVESEGGTAQFVATDVSQEEDVKALVAAAVRTYGKLAGACNAAGVSQRGKIMPEVTAEAWARCHGIHPRGSRKSDAWGKSELVRVHLGGSRTIKHTKTANVSKS